MKEIEIKNMAFDSVRYLLPAAALTNLGMTVNARSLEWAIAKLMTHSLEELQEIGSEVKEAAIKVTPTLIKYTNHNQYLGETSKEMGQLAQSMVGKQTSYDHPGVLLVQYDADAEDKVITGLLYRFLQLPYLQIQEKARAMKREEKEIIIDAALNKLGKFDRPLREFEHIYFTFDVLMDYGAFRDVQRHRMCTQTNQEFSAEHGYTTPPEIKEAGFEKEFTNCMKKAKDAFETITKTMPKEAQYIIPLAYNKRVLMTMNLRELFHFIKLRSGKMGHTSYRKIAQQMYTLIKEKQPLLAKHIECDMS